VILECPILSRVRIISSPLEFLNEDFQGVGVCLIWRSLSEGQFYQSAFHV